MAKRIPLDSQHMAELKAAVLAQLGRLPAAKKRGVELYLQKLEALVASRPKSDVLVRRAFDEARTADGSPGVRSGAAQACSVACELTGVDDRATQRMLEQIRYP